MKKQATHRYKTMLHGQEVLITVYEPATEEDMAKTSATTTHEDRDCDTEEAEEPDLFDELTDERLLWLNLAEENEE